MSTPITLTGCTESLPTITQSHTGESIRLGGCNVANDYASCLKTLFYNEEYSLECFERPDLKITITAGTCVSQIGQNDADSQARGLAAAQRTLNPCVPLYWNTEQTATCPEGSTGDPVTIEAHTYSSLISQEDADAKALTAAQALLSCQSGIPDLDLCGPQVWPATTSGTPYINTGDNTTGWIHLGGDGDFTSDGTIITMPDNSVSSYISIPVIVGDFSLSCEILFSDATNGDFTVALMDANSQMAVGLQMSPAGSDTPTNYFGGNCSINVETPFGLFDFDPPISAASDIPTATWVPVTLSRSGSVFTASINGTPLNYDCGALVNMQIGFGAYGVGDKSIRNISIN